MRKFLIPLSVLLVLAFIITGCGGGTTTPATTAPTSTAPKTTAPTVTSPVGTTSPVATATTTAPPASGQPRYGGRLKLIGGSNVANMGNPDEISNPGDATYAYPAVEGLLKMDAKGNLLPNLAEKWEISPDGKYVTFYLRRGVKFHDGSPFNAESAKYNMDVRINTKAWANFKAFSRAEVIDEYTMRVYFGDRFDWTAIKSLAYFFSGMEFSMKALKEQTPEWLRSHPIGTGPFKFREYKRDQIISYDRNDDYWGGKPYLDGVDFIIIPDTTTQLLAFKSGEVYVLGVQAKDAAGLKKEGYQLFEGYDVCFNIGMMPDSNNAGSPFSKIEVRRAVEYASDKQSIVDAITYGYGRVSNQVFIESEACYNPNVVGYPYNPAKAKELLTAAGYPNGFKFKCMMVDVMPLDFPTMLQDQLKKLGIIMEFNRVSLPQFSFQVGPGGGWEGWAVGGTYTGPAGDPAGALRNGPINENTTWISTWEPPELIDLARKAASELDPNKRTQMYKEISKKMTDDYAMVQWLYYVPFITAVSPKLKGHTIGQGGTFAYTHAWLEP